MCLKTSLKNCRFCLALFKSVFLCKIALMRLCVFSNFLPCRESLCRDCHRQFYLLVSLWSWKGTLDGVIKCRFIYKVGTNKWDVTLCTEEKSRPAVLSGRWVASCINALILGQIKKFCLRAYVSSNSEFFQVYSLGADLTLKCLLSQCRIFEINHCCVGLHVVGVGS